MKTQIVIFPFDLFGGGGAAAGAQLLADALREMLADNRRERIPTRAKAYQNKVQIQEFTFDTVADYETWRTRAGSAIRKALRNDAFLVWITGGHLGALPIYDELSLLKDETMVVQFDAHLDVYNLSDCTAELSHGNFLLHCNGKLPPLFNVGHRELLLRSDYVGRFYQRCFSAADLAVDPEPTLAHLRESAAAPARIFVDIDCDVLDPAFFPAVGHAVPFGMTPHLLLRLLDAIWSGRVIGMALSEFEPARDCHDRSLATLVWLLEYVLLKRHE